MEQEKENFGEKKSDTSSEQKIIRGRLIKKFVIPDPEKKTIQNYINASDDGTIVEARYNIYKKNLDKRGFQLIHPDNAREIAKGDRIAYVDTNNKWRSGGFVIEIHKNEEFIQYKMFNGQVSQIQFSDIQDLWWQPKKEANKFKGVQFGEDDKIVLKKPDFISNYPVVLKNSKGKDVVVYYADDNSKKNRYMGTNKFKLISEFGWIFEDGTEELKIE